MTEEAPLRTKLFPYRGQEARLGNWATDYEKILVEEVVRNGGMDWTILRLPKVYGLEDNGDLATIYGFERAPDWRWTHGYISNVADAIALAADTPTSVHRIYNVGERVTPTMAERLSYLPRREGAAQQVPPFDFRQSIVYDTGTIRAELGYREPFNERDAMKAIARGQMPDRPRPV